MSDGQSRMFPRMETSAGVRADSVPGFEAETRLEMPDTYEKFRRHRDKFTPHVS